MMWGRGRESKNVSGPVLEKVPLRVEGACRLEGGSGGAGGREEVERMRLGMVAGGLWNGDWKHEGVSEIGRTVV